MANDWWLDFFDCEGSECTLTTNTKEVVEFIHKLCELKENTTVLDLCCGKGYLSDALSQRGVRVTGIDASAPYIDFAKAHYKSDRCQFILGDARDFLLEEKVDLAINWHTSFAYCEEDDENIKMIKSLSDHLKVGGKFIFSTINPDYILANFQRFIVRYIDYEESSIIAIRESYLENGMLKSDWVFVFPDGRRVHKQGQTKLYSLDDFNRMLTQHNLMIENVYGTLGFEAFHQYAPNLIIYGRKVAC